MSGSRDRLFNAQSTTQPPSATIRLSGTDEWSFQHVYDENHQAMRSVIESFEMGEFNHSEVIYDGFQAIFHLKDLSTLTLEPPHVEKHGRYENHYRFNVLSTCAARSLLDVLYQAGCIEKSVVNFTAHIGVIGTGSSTGFYLPVGYGKDESWQDKVHELTHSGVKRITAYSNDRTKHPGIISIEFSSYEKEAIIRETLKNYLKKKFGI